MTRRAQRLLLVALSTALALPVAETAARAVFRWRHGFGFGESLLYVADPVLDYRVNPLHRPVRAGTYLGITPAGGGGSADALTVIALGGSMTWGHDNDGRFTWPSQLERFLNDADAPGTARVRVVNGGTSGYGSRHLRLRFERETAPLDPALVLVDATWNGVGSVADARAWMPENIAGRHGGARRRIAAWLNGHSVLAAKTRWFKNAVRQPPGLEAVATLFEDDLRQLVAQAAARRVQVVLLQAPSLWALDGNARERDILETLRPGQAQYWAQATANQRLAREIIRRVARDLDVPVIDGAAFFEPLAPAERSALFSDYMHLTDAGNTLLAQGIAAHCRALVQQLTAARAERHVTALASW